jgi:hypothetical protein
MLAHLTLRFLIFCAFVLIIIPSAFGQPASRDPQNKPRKIRSYKHFGPLRGHEIICKTC